MADWSDIVGLTVEKARERAARYDHELAIIFVGDERSYPQIDPTCATVLVAATSESDHGVVTRQYGIEHPTLLRAGAR